MENIAVVQKFLRLINDYVAAGQHFEYLQVTALKEQRVTPKAKELLGYPADANVSIYDLVYPSVEILPQLRFGYLATLMEAFVEEFICGREGINRTDLDTALRTEQSNWMRAHQGEIIGSVSRMNMWYVREILTSRYGFSFPNTPSLFWEIGTLRNVMVHTDGVVESEAYRIALNNVFKEAGAPGIVGSRIIMSGDLLFKFIEASRAFLKECDR